MKGYALIILLIIPGVASNAQKTRDCGTPLPTKLIFVDSTAIKPSAPNATYPLILKVFVHVIANDDGTNVAAGDSSVMRQVQNMRDFYAPHGICFILAGYEQINSTDLNTHNSSTEESDLTPFLIPGLMNIFVHRALSNDEGSLNGTAYSIPNYYLSIVASAVTSISNRSTMSHEMGHDLGLYHTFQSRQSDDETIRENVARSGSCKNCDVEGDLICDTQADRELDDDEIDEVTCAYINSLNDACNTAMVMEPTNIMTYGRRSCRNHFTVQQGNRAEFFILNWPEINNSVAPDAIFISANVNTSAGRTTLISRNSLVITASSFIISGTARANLNSSEITLPPGVTLSPSSNGYTSVRANTLCQ